MSNKGENREIRNTERYNQDCSPDLENQNHDVEVNEEENLMEDEETNENDIEYVIGGSLDKNTRINPNILWRIQPHLHPIVSFTFLVEDTNFMKELCNMIPLQLKHEYFRNKGNLLMTFPKACVLSMTRGGFNLDLGSTDYEINLGVGVDFIRFYLNFPPKKWEKMAHQIIRDLTLRIWTGVSIYQLGDNMVGAPNIQNLNQNFLPQEIIEDEENNRDQSMYFTDDSSDLSSVEGEFFKN